MREHYQNLALDSSDCSEAFALDEKAIGGGQSLLRLLHFVKVPTAV